MKEINYDAINKSINTYRKEAEEKFERCKCVCCQDQIRIEDFRDELSYREFDISGLCQDCQDEIFNLK